MKRIRGMLLVLCAVVALLFSLGCGLLARSTPTAQPTEGMPTLVPTAATAVTVSSATPAAVASATPTALVPASSTPTALAVASPTPLAVASPTPTPLPPTHTFTPPPPPATFTPVPTQPAPTHTPTPTRVPPSPTVTATFTPVPPLVITDWRGEYYANRSLQAPPRLVRNDQVLDFSLVTGMSPATNLPSENWSARWTRTVRFREGNYRFRLLVDDGARLWVGGRPLIDAWSDGPAREFAVERYLKGQIPIQLDYYNGLGLARVRLTWEQVTHFDNWLGSYYEGRDLSGLPIFQRDDEAIQFKWGTGAPRADMPADNFSVRWTRRLAFAQGGQYRFHAESDDGVRLWVDGATIIDAWRDGPAELDGLVTLAAGAHDLQLDYYEHLGTAYVQLSWQAVQSTVTPTATPTRSPTPSPTVTPAPTDTPVLPTRTPRPIRPTLVLKPAAGPIGVPFGVVGDGWPAGATVRLALLRNTSQQDERGESAAEVPVDAAGHFETQLVIPPNRGWEGVRAATVTAQAAQGASSAQAVYRLLPDLRPVEFGSIPSSQDRFALADPAYLVLDTAEQWSLQFGAEPPPADPPLDWQREIVLGAFLGSQPQNLALDVASIVQRDRVVSVWLTAIVPRERIPQGEGAGRPRVLVRVARQSLQGSNQGAPAGLVFDFLDATGRLLAQVTPGSLPPNPPPHATRESGGQGEPVATGEAGARAIAPLQAAPVPTSTQPVSEVVSTSVEAPAVVGASSPQSGTQPLPEAGALPSSEAQTAPQQPVPAATVVAAAPAEKEAEQPEETSRADEPPANWVWIGTAAFLVLGWGTALGVSRRLSRRR